MLNGKERLNSGAVWITGLTASGKTTIAKLLYNELIKRRFRNVLHLDGEQLRNKLLTNYGHTLEDRLKVASDYVKIVNDHIKERHLVIISTVTHKKIMRDRARAQIENFMEVYLDCPSDICAKRDFKGLYSKAIEGEIKFFPGVTEPYEESDNPELVLNTNELSAIKCAEILSEKVLTFFSIKINA